MKIRTRAFLLGLLPTLLVAIVLTAYHLYSRLNDLDTTLNQQGLALARHLASSAEYGVLSGNKSALEKLLDQVLREPGVKSAMVIWPDQAKLIRGETAATPPFPPKVQQWQARMRYWFSHPVEFVPVVEADPLFDDAAGEKAPLAWVVVSLDANQNRQLAQRLLLASLGITALGLALAILLINKLALTGVKPLMDLISSVRNISSGDFGKRVKITAHSPELRQLQTMVNKMSESLRSYQQEMEAKVRSVTAELEHKTREAEQANLAKSKFLATASHDLRQPMHAISLYVEGLKPQMQGRAAEDTLNRIERSTQSMVELFNAILDVTKLDAGAIHPQIGPVRVRQLLLRLADEFAAEADAKGLSLRVHAADVWVESDEMLLERIIRNLLSNAVRHTMRGGVLLSARRCAGRIRLQIWDTGRGIEAEYQARVFDEFYQVGSERNETRQGLGLGLSIVRRLTRLLGYPLELHSQPGQGTVFSLDLPRLDEVPRDSQERERGAGVSLTGRVLVVDDDPVVLDALARLLQQWGLEVAAANNLMQAERGLEIEPDIVLADYQLSDGETGLMVEQATRLRWGDAVPVVLITGDTRTETIRALRSSGVPVLHKPVRTHQLMTLMHRLLSPTRRPDEVRV